MTYPAIRAELLAYTTQQQAASAVQQHVTDARILLPHRRPSSCSAPSPPEPNSPRRFIITLLAVHARARSSSLPRVAAAAETPALEHSPSSRKTPVTRCYVPSWATRCTTNSASIRRRLHTTQGARDVRPQPQNHPSNLVRLAHQMPQKAAYNHIHQRA